MKRLFVIISIILVQRASAQEDIRSLLEPGLPPVRIGIEAGPTFNRSSGTFQSTCDARFGAGDGVRLTIGAVGELPISKRFMATARLSVDNKGFVVTTTQTGDFKAFDAQTGDSVVVRNVSMNQKATVSLMHLSFAPMLRFRFFNNFFISVGPSVSMVMKHSLVNENEIVTLSAVDENGRSHAITYSDGSVQQTSQPKNIPDLHTVWWGLVGGVSYDIPVSPRSFLSPSVYYVFPLTTLSDTDAKNWKVTNLQTTLTVKFLL